MRFAIDLDSAVAPFEQLKRQIFDQARAGSLPAGTRLPPVRQLAQELDLAPNTVARAYRELEHDAIVVTRGRLGTFVASDGDAAHRLAHEAALAYADRVRALGLDARSGVALVEEALRRPQ